MMAPARVQPELRQIGGGQRPPHDGATDAAIAHHAQRLAAPGLGRQRHEARLGTRLRALLPGELRELIEQRG